MISTELEQQRNDVETRRDPRFDGQFFSAVLTTGIFCRPGCPGRPRAENVRFFSTAAAAAEAGFRPCLRCHPESAPDAPERLTASPIIARALRLISEGMLDSCGVGELAARLNVSSRQLQRLFVEELGAPPVAVAQTRRLLFAKKLIDETSLSMTEIAFSAGYSSVRRFNEAIQQTYARTPTELRRWRRSSMDLSEGMVGLKLFYRDPYNWPAMLAFLSTRSTPLVEVIDGDIYRRSVVIGEMSGVIEVRPLAERRALLLRVPVSMSRYLLPVTERVKRMFDLKADPIEIDDHLLRNSNLAPLIRSGPGVRIPGCWDGFEVALRAVIDSHAPEDGRQIMRLLVERFGTPIDVPGGKHPSRCFPSAAHLSTTNLTESGVPASLADQMHRLSEAIASGAISLSAATTLEQLSAQLRGVIAVDGDALQYIGLRLINDPDLDLMCNRILFDASDVRSLRPVADKASPWRSHAAMYLWSAIASGGQPPVHAAPPANEVSREGVHSNAD